MCHTLRYPFDSLNTAAPLDPLAASALPQCSQVASRAFPRILGRRTQTLAVPRAASHSSISYASGVPSAVDQRSSSPLGFAWLKSKKVLVQPHQQGKSHLGS